MDEAGSDLESTDDLEFSSDDLELISSDDLEFSSDDSVLLPFSLLRNQAKLFGSNRSSLRGV